MCSRRGGSRPLHLQSLKIRASISFPSASFASLREMPLPFRGVLSTQKESSTEASSTVIFLARKCRITVVLSFWRLYRLAATNHKYGVDGRLLDRSNKIQGERIALIAAPEHFRGLRIEAWKMRSC